MQAHDNSQSAMRLDAQNATAYWFTSRCDRVWAKELNTNAPRKYVNNDNLRDTGWWKYLIMYICMYLYLYINTYLYISMHIYLFIDIYKKETQLYIDIILQWRHNGCDSVSNHQPLLNRLFRRRSKKTSKLCVTGLCAGNSPGTSEFPAQMASHAENVSIWWRHHEHD